MAIIRQTNKKTGITYVIESESYWDKEKQQPRSRRRIIGKIDEATGEVVPTRRQNRRSPTNTPQAVEEASRTGANLSVPDGQPDDKDKDARILELEEQVARLQKEKEDILCMLERLTAQYRS